MNSSHSFCLLIITLGCLSSTGSATCHPDDEAGLLAFKSGITQDPSGLLTEWKKGTDCCKWYGVSCYTDDRVTSLLLIEYSPERVLSGTISPFLSKLKHLTDVGLGGFRNITGPFPEFLLHLPKLNYLVLENLGLSGPLPTNIGKLSHLDLLFIRGNKFMGLLPTSLSNLSRLKALDLSDNLLTGTIPLGFANLKLMESLDLSGNRLSGTIPDIFKSMTKLHTLTLSNNAFSGELSPWIASLSPQLMRLNLGQNNLSGSIPSSISNLKGLSSIDLSKNRFSGVVPTSLVKLTDLGDIDLSYNLFTGSFPTFDSKKNIGSLDLSYNQFHMENIPDLTSAPYLTSLKLAKCGIKMKLDDWKPLQKQYVMSIDLSENDISGSLRSFFKKQRNVGELLASGNKLRFDLGSLDFYKRLETLDLSRNLIFGKVPAVVAKLKTLNLSHNHLCGKLPTTKFSASAFVGNDCLCGSPLASC